MKMSKFLSYITQLYIVHRLYIMTVSDPTNQTRFICVCSYK